MIRPEGIERVTVIDRNANVIGWAAKEAAHRGSGIRHLAFSVFLFDAAGSLLMQRRAAFKSTFAGLWSNSCCGHPRPGEPVRQAARRRTEEELGLVVSGLVVRGAFWYSASDGARGEFEYDVVLTAQVERNPLAACDREVLETRWATELQLSRIVRDPPPPGLTPWFGRGLDVALRSPQAVAGTFEI